MFGGREPGVDTLNAQRGDLQLASLAPVPALTLRLAAAEALLADDRLVPVTAIATTAVTLASLAAGPVDGAALADGAVVLLTAQVDGKENGIYERVSGVWTRRYGSAAAMAARLYVALLGTANRSKVYTLAPGTSPVVGTDNISFVELGTGGPATSVAWADIVGRPTTFPPAAHTHDAADVASGRLPFARLPQGGQNEFLGRVDTGTGDYAPVQAVTEYAPVITLVAGTADYPIPGANAAAVPLYNIIATRRHTGTLTSDLIITGYDPVGATPGGVRFTAGATDTESFWVRILL